MQDQSSIAISGVGFPQLKTPQLLEQEQLKCPRCESTNTKFCYYNNYNLSQPRHFCKNCRRYWTKGGALRNIPVGGGSRKNTKRTSSKRSGTSPVSGQVMGPSTGPEGKGVGVMGNGGGGGGGGVGSFTSLLGLASEGQFGNLFFEGLGQNGLRLGEESGAGQNSGLKVMQEGNGGSVVSQGLMMMGSGVGVGSGDHQMQSCWGGGGGDNNNGWPDLAIYTPGSKFQ